MTTTYHTPIPSSPPQPANAATINGPLAELDAELVAQDARIDDLETDMPVPSGSSTEYYDGDGNWTVPAGTGAGIDGHVIQDEGVDMVQRAKINFVGAGVTVTNEAGGTQVEIPGPTGLTAASIEFTATDKLLGRATSGAGVGEEIPLTAAGRALIASADAADQRALLGITNGWLPDANTWTYSSADSPTGVFSVNADLSSIVSNGMRIRFDQLQELTAYFPFDVDSMSTVGSFTSTDTAMTYTSGKFSNAATFNGTTSKIVITDTALMKPTGEFTLGVWFKTSVTATTQTIFQSYSANTNRAGIQIFANSANILLARIGKNTGATSGVDSIDLTGTINICDNSWHYLVVAYRNNYLQLYVDGILDGAGYCIAPSYATTNYVRIGCACANGTDNSFAAGQIDDLFLINGYALDEKTIYDNYIANTAQGTGDITVTKKAIITNVGAWSGSATLVTCYHGTDFSLVNSTIGNVYYSNEKVPFGFNPKPDKWTVLYESVIDLTQGSPGAGTAYNVGSVSISEPIGAWDAVAVATADLTITVATVTSIAINFSLGPSSSALATNELSGKYRAVLPIVTGGIIGHRFRIGGAVNTLVKKTLYLLASSSVAGTTLGFYGTSASTLIKLICAYL